MTRRPQLPLPQIGSAGSRSAALHSESPLLGAISGLPAAPTTRLSPQELTRFAILRWLGTLGCILLSFGALGAGALPVVDNPWNSFPGGSLLSRMLQTSSMMVLIGVGLVVVAWALMGPFVAIIPRVRASVDLGMLRRTYIAWVLPIILTAPLFTQDIYSYLAQGSIVAHGLDPYSAGPVDLLGPDNHLARSVPFIWSHSPSPYGPVAMWLAAAISRATADSILLGVISHRILSVIGIAAAGWAVVLLARRCHVNPAAALWLGILNPLTILHLIGGIHNEAILLGLMLPGLELGFRAVDTWTLASSEIEHPGMRRLQAAGLWVCCTLLITGAGMVKVTGFIALGFIGMAVARLLTRRFPAAVAVILSALAHAFMLVLGVVLVTWLTGIGLGWITGQGGAVSVRSWLSLSTATGVIAGWFGMILGLGDHTEAILYFTRGAAVAVAGAFILRMLLATFRGVIHPVGAYGVATFVLVILFPVVQPWYMLWAIVPLAAWANRMFFRTAVVAYSAVFSFLVLPRGLGLPPLTVFTIYSGFLIASAIIFASLWWMLKRRGIIGLH